jgi:acetyltransferase-like isoleucine patch superfamily enzyme
LKSNTILEAAIETKNVSLYAILAGVPAKVTKENIHWK